MSASGLINRLCRYRSSPFFLHGRQTPLPPAWSNGWCKAGLHWLKTSCWSPRPQSRGYRFSPSLEEARILAPRLDCRNVWACRNFVLLLICCWRLASCIFMHGKSRATRLRFDPRELRKSGRTFTFNNQVRDNMFWSLRSGVLFWTLYEVLMFWSMANGYAPVLAWDASPVWFIAAFALTPLWISFHFYWIHRWLHWPPLYRIAHALHHRNTNVGPWSGLSMHPIECALFFSSVLLHFIVPVHPLHILFHLQHQGLTSATSHTGFEGCPITESLEGLELELAPES